MARSTTARLRSLLLAGVMTSAAVAAAQSATTQASRLAVPSGPRVQEARLALEELCSARLRGATAIAPARLAEELLAKAQRPELDGVSAYTLLERARTLAVSASDGPLALRATRAAAPAPPPGRIRKWQRAMRALRQRSEAAEPCLAC